jgi:NAD(P)H-dependent flavin oxidoreductase YrpB (nitropropane dioxygenase family)
MKKGLRDSASSVVGRRRILQMLGLGGAALTVGCANVVIEGEPVGEDEQLLEDGELKKCNDGSNSLCTRLTEEYGITFPIVGAGIAFHALPSLVAAISNAGALGVLGGSPEGPAALAQLIREVKALTERPFGVDLVHASLFGGAVPAVTEEHIDVCVQEGVKIVVFFWNTPPASWVAKLHAAGAKVWMQVGSLAGALEAVNVGIDAIIVQGKEAGGHVRGAAQEDAGGGAATPLDVLLPAVVEAVAPRIVLAAGGIADGKTLKKALKLGAEGAWVGTRMMASVEAYCHPEFKRRIVAAGEGDTVITTMFGPEWPGEPIRSIRNRVVNEWAGREDEIPVPPPPPAIIGTTILFGFPYAMPKFSVILPTPDTTGDFEEMCMSAGEKSAPLVNDIKPAAQIIEDMVENARALLEDEYL